MNVGIERSKRNYGNTANGTHRYIDIIQALIDRYRYKSTRHRSMGTNRCEETIESSTSVQKSILQKSTADSP